MEKLKVYVSIDKKTGELLSFENHNTYEFEKYRKNVGKEYGAVIKEAVLTIKTKGIDYSLY